VVSPGGSVWRRSKWRFYRVPVTQPIGTEQISYRVRILHTGLVALAAREVRAGLQPLDTAVPER